ncbi:SLATT domain-containing protein [Marinobacter sp. ST-43]|uniref:SLATT domain-containing protein n=1 Tax=Marinobacter sp. ST-43 TaxID=3050453 RepID=UPI0026E0A3DA|nr:SLATT domain-containing protein [Marinobacter sp. ST-43]
MKKEDSFGNLYKKVDATSKTRFHASRRLKLHSKLSTHTVVIISLGLILISLMQAYELGRNISSDLVALVQVFSAIAVLVYSLLIERNDYSNLSEKMYSCAAKLGELKQKIYPHLGQSFDAEAYDKLRNEYHSVLKLFETHSNSDFRADYFRAKLEMPENYDIKGGEWWKTQASIILSHALSFSSYIVVIGTLLLVILWIWIGGGPDIS